MIDTFILRVVAITLAVVILSLVGAMIMGLFHPAVDNKEVFTILGPAFQMIVGAFVGRLSATWKPSAGHDA